MIYSVLNYGADSTGETLSTKAIQNAIDDASKCGGRVYFPAGTYKTGTVWLKSNVELNFSLGSKLLASDDLADYNQLDAYPQNFCSEEEQWNGCHLIIAHEAENIAITGLGTIDGNAKEFYCSPIPWDGYTWEKGLALAKDKKNLRPGQLISIIESRNIHISDVSIQNATCWCCFLHGCENVFIRGIKITNPPENANTDGIDIDTCSNVTISDCIIDTGDDAIALRCDGDRVLHKEPVCEYITITNCVLASSSSVFRIGVGRGTLRHIRVDNIVMKRGAVGMCFMGCWTIGKYTNILDTHFSRISAEELSFPFQINSIEGAVFDDISITDMRANCSAMGSVNTNSFGTLNNILLSNIKLKYRDKPIVQTEKTLDARGDHIFCLGNANGLTIKDFEIDVSEIDKSLWKGIIHQTNCAEVQGEIKFKG